ncbi:MAG: hypothetical protein Q8P13_03020 [bacterium]|nr:hypothetical protein [bacterium]
MDFGEGTGSKLIAQVINLADIKEKLKDPKLSTQRRAGLEKARRGQERALQRTQLTQ